LPALSISDIGASFSRITRTFPALLRRPDLSDCDLSPPDASGTDESDTILPVSGGMGSLETFWKNPRDPPDDDPSAEEPNGLVPFT
jgi:hypothetical protein